jgi:AraC family transcriptional regulator
MREATLQDYKSRILRVLVHIQRRLDDELELEELAGVAAFSPYHFHRVFKGMVGESVKAHVRRLRLERAATQLKLSEQAVTTIALESGYRTHEAFTRAFRELFGDSPSGFRSSRALVPRADAPSDIHYGAGEDVVDFRPYESGGEAMQVDIETVEPIRVAFMRHVGAYDQCGQTWERFLTWAGSEGHLGAGTRFIGLCHDDPEITPSEKIRYDACISVGEGFKPLGEIGVQTIEGGPYARTTHFGPYDRLGETYTRLLGQWAPRSGRRIRAAPCFEVYLNSPEDTDPEELLTDIYLALEPNR